MSYLFGLQPIGVGTEAVESFTSYMFRLASLHGISLGRLIEWMQWTDEEDPNPILDVSTTTANPWSTVAMVRPTDSVRDLVALTSRLTRCETLRSTTFLALSKLNYRSRDLFDNRLRWCPACWEDDVKRGSIAYYRLLWSFHEVDYCRVHNVELESRCSHCDRSPNGVGRRSRLHRCPTCDGSLMTRRSPMPTSNLFLQTVQCPDLRMLLVAVSADPALEYQPGDAQALLRKIFDRVWELDDERAFWEVASRREMLALVTSEKTATIKNLRRAAYSLGIDFPGLLGGELECYTAQLDPEWLSKLPKAMRPPKRRRLVDRKELLAKLEAVQGSIDPDWPPPLSQLAKLVGVSTGGLEYLHPEVCKEIKANYQRWRTSELVRKRAEAMVEVWQYLADAPSKSRKGALRAITARTSLPKNLLREVIAAEFIKASKPT